MPPRIIQPKKLPTATPDEFEGQTLMRMRTENIKRVRLVDVTFSEPLTLIGGDNAQGKSSFLDSYQFCLGGKTEIQMDPVRHGEQTGSVQCDFGDGKQVKLSVKRTIMRLGDKEFTSDVDIEIPGHVAPSTVETFLKKLAGDMSFDPMAFDDATDEERFNILRGFVSHFDFDKNKADYDKAYRERTDVNRDMKREQGAADSITVPATPPCEFIDEGALVAELEDAGRRNTERATREANRASAREKIEAYEQIVASLPARLEAARAKRIADLDTSETASRERILDYRMQIRALEEKIAREEAGIRDAKQLMEEASTLEAEEMRNAAYLAQTDAEKLKTRLNEAGELPDVIDTAEISARLAAAREGNERYLAWKQQRERKAAYEAEAERLSEQSAAITAVLQGLVDQRATAIREANLPVAGLGFGDGYVTLNDVPWSQASRAERIDASTAIAMALNPKLKVILIRDGSNLGKSMKERIRQRAIDNGYRVLMEVVDESGGTHVVIEDGLVKATVA